MTPEQAAQRIFMLKKAIKEMETEAADLAKEHFATRDVDTYAEGKFKVVVGRNARFSPTLAKELLTEEEYNSILETAPSGTKAKKVLSPETYRILQKDAALNKVTITLPEED